MVYAVKLEVDSAPLNKRVVPRSQVRLTVAADIGAGEQIFMIRDLSVTGMLLETEAELSHGQVLTVELPQDHVAAAKVLWRSGHFYGCEFESQLSIAALSAARLRSAFETPSGPKHVEQVSPDFFQVELPHPKERANGGELDYGTRVRIILGLGLAAWAVIIGTAGFAFRLL